MPIPWDKLKSFVDIKNLLNMTAILAVLKYDVRYA